MKTRLRHQLLETRENRYCLHTQRKIPPLSHMRRDGPGRATGGHTHAPPPCLVPLVFTSP